MAKTIRYFGYAVKDILKFTPVVFWGKLTANFLEGCMRVWQPLLIAQIFELVPNLNAGSETEQFKRSIASLCLCITLPVICYLIIRIVRLYDDCKKEKFYGWKMFEHAQNINLEALEESDVLNTFQKANAAYAEYQAGNRMFSYVMMIAESCFVCGGTILVAGRFSPWLIPCALLGFFPHLAGKMLAEKLRSRVYRGQASKRRTLQYLWRLFCSRESVKEIRTMGFGSYLKELWVEANLQVVQEMRNVELKVIRISVLDKIIKNACYTANVAAAIFLMIQGKLAVGQFAACLSAFTILQNELMSLGGLIGSVAEQYRFVEDYYDFFQVETEKDGQGEVSPLEKEIVLEDVHFRYRGADKDSLQGVNLKIKKGEHVVIVGVNGSGKTTLSKVLTGVYTPKSGSVLYDGQDTAKMKKSGLYRQISIVPQNFVHYNFTLRENICISSLKHRNDDSRLDDVIKAVEIQEMVQSIGGADSPLGREFGGRELSGGEWQKVAIARGLFKDSELIVLDEPTSCLDPLIEYEILNRFLELTQDKTSVIISHRVGICRTADKIVVMKDGRVVECGTHEELTGAGGEYTRIWTEQAKWY